MSKHVTANDLNEDTVVMTTLKIVVLSKGGKLLDHPTNQTDLEQLAYEIKDGEWIGQVTKVSSEILPPTWVSNWLRALGNDGSFFD